MKALVFDGEKAAIRDDVEVRAPGPNEVKVRLVAAGFCHSDVSLMEGLYAWPSPVVLGHEGAGVVAEVGDAVTNVAPGDHVVLHTLAYCGMCKFCVTGKPHYCRKSMLNMSQPFSVGGEPAYNFAAASFFSEYSVVQAKQCVKVATTVDLESACLIGCGVLTGAGAVWNRGNLQRGQTCVVIGVGGVGLNSIQAASIAGASRIIAVDTVPAKEKWARQFGATDFLLTGPGVDIVSAVRELVPFSEEEVNGPFQAGGVDFVFDVVGAPATVAQAVEMLDWGGTVVIVGVPGPTAEVHALIPRLMHVERGIVGCRAGSTKPHHDIALIVDLYQRGIFKLDELVTAKYALDDWETAMHDQHEGKLARGVLQISAA